MRAIVLLNSLYTGGAEFSTLLFYQWLKKQGHEVTLVCLKKANPSFDAGLFGFNKVHYLQGNYFLSRLKDFNTVVKRMKPQWVHSVLFDANMMGRASRITHGKFIHLESLVNEMYSSNRLADPNITRFKLEGYRVFDALTQRWGVDHFHANGFSVARHYSQKLGIAPNRMTVIHRGREQNPFVGDATHRQQVRQEFHTGDRLMIMSVARHEFQKGQDVLLEAVNRLGEWQEKIQVVVVGREGSMTGTIQERIQKYHLEKTVVITGHRNDVSALLAAADLFVFPSRFEGLPGSLIEAEAAGLPIICSDIPNNREVAEESRNALFFGVDDVERLSQMMLKLLNDAALRSKMSAESLMIYKQKFSLEEVHQKMLALMEDLIRVR